MALRRNRGLWSGVALVLLGLPALTAYRATAQLAYFRYERSVGVPEGVDQACALLDAPVFPHAAPYLRDMRLDASTGGRGEEIPYAITLSEPEEQDSETAQVMNLELHGRAIVFDLKMPKRLYTDVVLDLGARDFVATAKVSGGYTPGSESTPLGEFTLFDLTSQHLARGTTLHLQESRLPYLHVVLLAGPAVGGAPFEPTAAMIRGAIVPPSREAQSLFTTVAETGAIAREGRSSVARFTVAQRVPVERISVVLEPGFKGNFSRTVRVDDHRLGDADSAGESAIGTIDRVDLVEGGQEIDQQQMSVVTTVGANLQGPAAVRVSVDNGDQTVLPIKAVRLEMRERRLCFDARLARGGAVLFYGDPTLSITHTEYAPEFASDEKTGVAQLGPEMLNPVYQAPSDERGVTRRRRQALWMGLLAIASFMSIAAYRASRHTHP